MRTYILITFIAILAAVYPARADTPVAALSAAAQEHIQKLSGEELRAIGEAAQAGDAASLARLGSLYALGAEVPQNYGHAYFLLVLAKLGGDETYEYMRKDLLKLMTPDTVRAISRRAHSWQPGMEVNITQEGEAAPLIVLPPEDSWFTKIKKQIKLMYFQHTVDY